MAANSHLYFLTSCFILLTPIKTLATDLQLINLLEQDVKKSMIILSNKITECAQEATTSSLDLDIKSLKDLGLNKNSLLKSLYYLNIRNRNLCEMDARKSLSFSIGQLDFTRSELGLPPSEYYKSGSIVLYESSDVIKMRVHYESQSDASRKELERQIGTTIFDFSLVTKAVNAETLN